LRPTRRDVTYGGALGLLAVALAAGIAGARSGMAPAAVRSVEIGGPFRLTGLDGRPFGSEDLKGRPYALFFGFTHCPDICPTTLHDLTQALATLDPAARDFRVLFVSVDPERDTPPFLRDYLSAFDPRITALTGSPREIAATAAAFGATYAKIPTEGGGYTMDHTATVYLMNSDGRFAGALDHHESADIHVAKLRRLLGR
jgi:protein SCO1/2